MNDDTDKLAAEMQNLRPSKTSRESGLSAAMAAFNQEFSAETTDAKAASSEKLNKNPNSTQGLTDDPRPTGQTTKTVRAKTRRVETMSKFKAAFNFKPQTMMMAGTCSAALIAAMIVIPNMDELTQNVPPVAASPAEVAQEAPKPTELKEVEPLDVKPSEGAKQAEIKPDVAKPDVAKPDVAKPDVAKPLEVKSVETTTTVEPQVQAGPQTIVKTRRVLKTPARTTERTVPSVTKTETRRRVKTPASTVERSIPAVTKQVPRRVPKGDGTFETVSETVVVQPASVEYVTLPPVYETYEETIAVQEASTELVSIPATFDTIRETIEIQADGTEKVISSEVVADTNASKPPPAITSVDSLLNSIRKDSSRTEAENKRRAAQFKQRVGQKPSQPIGQAAPPSAPKIASQTAPASRVRSNPKSVPSRRNRGEALPSGSAPTSSSLPEKFAGLTLERSEPEFITKTETIVIQPASVEYVKRPPVYETVTETVVVQEASTELVTIPAEYEWVDGEIEGSAVVLETIPAEYETVSETVVVQEASVEYVSRPPSYETVQDTIVLQPEYVAKDGSIVPAITEEISRRVTKTPASTIERVIPAVTKQVSRSVVKTPSKVVERVVPYEKKDGKTRVVVKPASVQERTKPAEPIQVTRRVAKTPASTAERTIPAVTKQVQVRVLAPQKIYLRDDDGNIVREFKNRDAFENYKANLPTPVAEKPVSTFSVDVDTASYSFLRASINRGVLPPRASIRLEEMINYFPYDYDAPTSADEPFKANVTVTPTPWNADTKLMHIGIKGYVPTEVEKPRNNLVLLIDTSGSMKAQNKLPLLINSFKLLLNTLDENDTVSIVTYANQVGTALEPTRVRKKSDILAALEQLRANGGTAGAAGLQLAYEKAEENFDDEGNNRVILATDGDFNIGFSSPDEMKTFISKKRDTGISLSVLGFGQGNYNDHLMQSLAQNGNGVAAYIDTLAEANKVLANEAGSALITIAKDVKIQVEFNPATIAEYRLIGYETRALKRQDFNNDKVDAGEIGAGHSVTAIYEMTPVGSPAVTVDKLRYVAETPKTTTGSEEYAFVKIRHKLPDAQTSTLQSFPIGKNLDRNLKRASDDMRFAAAVAAVGQKLRGDVQLEDYSYKDAIKLAKKAKGDDEDGYRAEFIQMVKLIENMGE